MNRRANALTKTYEMQLKVVDNKVQVVSYSAEEYRWLDEALTFGYDRWNAAEKRMSTQAIHFLTGKSPVFPRGLLRNVVIAGINDDVPVNVDEQENRLVRDESADIGWLDDTQLKAFDRVVSKRNGILKLSTGSGKTEIAVALMHAFKGRWLFLVHKTNLLHQTAERYNKRTGDHAGIIGDGAFVPARVTVATYQTITKMLINSAKRKAMLEFLQSIDGVIADECHVVPSSTAYSTISHCKKADFLVGLSATPLSRSDQRSIYAIAALGPIIFKVNAAHSIEKGRLVKPTIRMLYCIHPSNKGSYQYVYKRFVIESDDRNALVAAITKKAAKPCMVFVKNIAHGNTLLKMIRKAGINANFVNGSHNTDKRRAEIKRLVRGDIDVIVTTPVFQEGVDIPSLASVVMAGSGASHIAALQSVGRVLRSDEGKQSAEIWDVFDSGINSLEKHARARATAYRSEGHTVLVGNFSTGFKELK